jgi:hypothetical protein
MKPISDHDPTNRMYFFSTIENCKEMVELTTKLNFVQFSCQLEGLDCEYSYYVDIICQFNHRT